MEKENIISKRAASAFFAEYSYIHNGKRGRRTAFEIGESARLALRIPREAGTASIFVDIYSESLDTLIMTEEFTLKSSEFSFDYYECKLNTKKLGRGLYFMKIRLYAFDKIYYSHKEGEGLIFNEDNCPSGYMQLTVSSFSNTVPEHILGGVIYHIFVDRFARGGGSEIPDGAVLVGGEWENIPEFPEYRGAPLKNNTFYGGTLYGIIDRLDYIASLGVKAIYLSPIFSSVSNHKYDTSDYMQVDAMFGGDEALSSLIKEAKKRGIGIILDGVFNHTGDDSIYFNRYGRFLETGAYQSKSSPYFEWYEFQNHPTEYTSWWGIEILPRINPDIQSCREYFTGKNGVISKYADMGIYGMRLDVADELSDGFIADIKSTLSKRGENVLYGEVWEDASNKISYGRRKRYYLGEELDGVMNYPVREGIIDFILHKSPDKLGYALYEVTYNAPERIMHTQMNLLGTHDTERILTVLGNENKEGLTNAELCVKRMSPDSREMAKRRLMSAYTVLSTLPGIPAVFYGDEAGLEGYHDPFNRMPYPYGKEDFEFIRHYRLLGKIRQDNEVYKRGEFELVLINPDALIFKRCSRYSDFLTVFNNSESEMMVEFNAKATNLLTKDVARVFNVKGGDAVVFKLKRSGKANYYLRGIRL